MAKLSYLLIVLFCYSSNIYCQVDSIGNSFMDQIDQTPVSMMSGHEPMKGMWMLTYSLMYSELRNNFSGSSGISDQVIFQKYIMTLVNMRMDMHMLMFMYDLSDKISIMFMGYYNFMTMTMKMLPGQMHIQG